MPDQPAPLTAAELAELRRLEAAMTPVEWWWHPTANGCGYVYRSSVSSGADGFWLPPVKESITDADGAGTVALRNAAPRLIAAAEEAERLRAAITEHHAQKADDRCIEDDDRLYAAAGLPPCDRRVGDKAAMLENCKRFIENRCEGGGPWKSYEELEAENERLREALKPFADYATAVSAAWPDSAGTNLLFRQPDGSMEHKPRITLGDCRRAAEVLASQPKEKSHVDDRIHP